MQDNSNAVAPRRVATPPSTDSLEQFLEGDRRRRNRGEGLTDREKYQLDPTGRWTLEGHKGICYWLTKKSGKLERTYGAFNPFVGKYERVGSKLADALEKQAEWRKAKNRGERVIAPKKVTIAQASEACFADVERRLRPGTFERYKADYEQRIQPRFGDWSLGAVRLRDVLEFDAALQKEGLSESTRANVLKPLRAIFRYAVENDWISSSPFDSAGRGRLPSSSTTRDHRAWTTAEVDAVIAAARGLDARAESRCQYGLLTEFLLRTGSRLGEALGAQFGDIDFDAGVFIVRRQLTKDGRLAEPKTKASTGRRIPLTDELIRQLAARSLELDADSDTFVFAPKKGAMPPTQSNYRRRGWNKAVEAAGLTDGPKLTPHDARHAFTSQLADLGLTSGDLAPVLGHSTAGITEAIYTHSFNVQEREARIRKAMTAAVAGGAS